MGGQACVFYGAAEFSRDLDLVILPDEGSLETLRRGLVALDAALIAIPRLDGAVLDRGHAVHFRCRAPGVEGLRIDLMARMRGVAPFAELWERRTTIETNGALVDLLSLPDLVQAKKTQRDKDWPMIRRLVEQSWYSATEPTAAAVTFWLRELRTPGLLIQAARQHPDAAAGCHRDAVQLALAGDLSGLEAALQAEESAERAADRAYWEPLKRELEQLRLGWRTSG